MRPSIIREFNNTDIKLNSITEHEAIVAESKKWPIQMICVTCGLVCGEGYRGVPTYLRSVGNEVTIEEQYKCSPLKVFKYNRAHLGGPLPPITESIKVVSTNVQAFLKAVKGIHLSNLEHFVCPFLFTSVHKEEYLNNSYELELALIHVLTTNIATVNELSETRHAYQDARILELFEEKVRNALKSHESLKNGIPDLNFDNRMAQIMQLINNFNIEGLINMERVNKVNETITNFIIPKLDMKKFLLWSNEVVASALTYLGCTYCAYQRPSITVMASRFDILPSIIYCTYIVMGEDLSRAEKS